MFCKEKEQLYQETDTSGVCVEAILLQVRDRMQFAGKSLKIMETCYSNIEKEALSILHGLENYHHYCFSCLVSVITDHKPLVAIFKKDVANLSHRLQWILLQINQYSIRILHKQGPQACRLAIQTQPWNRNGETLVMYITDISIVSCTDIPGCITADEIRTATVDNESLCILLDLILHGWPSSEAEVQKELQCYWSFWGENVIIDGIAKKGIIIIITVSLQDRALKQLHLIHMGIEMTRMSAHESIYRINMKANM